MVNAGRCEYVRSVGLTAKELAALNNIQKALVSPKGRVLSVSCVMRRALSRYALEVAQRAVEGTTGEELRAVLREHGRAK